MKMSSFTLIGVFAVSAATTFAQVAGGLRLHTPRHHRNGVPVAFASGAKDATDQRLVIYKEAVGNFLQGDDATCEVEAIGCE